MCQLFSGQDPAGYQHVTRSVRLNGCATSVRLEARFWDILDDIAAGEGTSTPRFLSTLNDEVIERRGEVRNFASILRVTCIIHLQRSQTRIESAA